MLPPRPGPCRTHPCWCCAIVTAVVFQESGLEVQPTEWHDSQVARIDEEFRVSVNGSDEGMDTSFGNVRECRAGGWA